MLKFQDKEVTISRLKEMSYDELNSLCALLREEILSVVSKNGGHLSSNLGVVELIVALVRFFDFPHDKLFIDVGHQSYTYKLLTGRDLSTLRKKGGISGFQKRNESIYDVFEAGHSSTSLSGAIGYAVARDLKKENYDVVALIGDSSIMNGLSLEALNDIGRRKNKVIIILNDNDMSVSKTVGAIHHVASAPEFYKNFGLNYIGEIDGHNILDIENALKEARNSDKSVIVHVITEKGKGYSYAQYDRLGIYHGISPFKVSTGRPSSTADSISYSSYFAKLVESSIKNDDKCVVINPAMVLGSSMQAMFMKYPDRCFDVGIAEEHAITFASGLALNGLKPIISIYSTFLQRGFDELSHDIARMKLPALFLIDRCGLVGEDGETHQGLYDEAFILNTPNMILCVPSDLSTSKALYENGINYNGPYAIRYPRGNYYNDDKEYELHLKIGKWLKLTTSKNNKIALITYGKFINEYKKEIVNNNLDVSLYNALYLNPFDEEMLLDIINHDNIIILNTMASSNGFNNKLISRLNELNYKGNIISKAVKNEFIEQGTIEEQLMDNGIDKKSILSIINSLLSK